MLTGDRKKLLVRFFPDISIKDSSTIRNEKAQKASDQNKSFPALCFR